VAVVSIVTIFAALAIPSAVNQLRDRRVQEAARQIAIVYRQARMHALGRGSAVLVHFEDGEMRVREAILGEAVGGEDNCADLPVSSCLVPDWANAASYREIDGFRVANTGLSSLTLGLTSGGTDASSDSGSTALTTLDVCFTPMGRTFARTAEADRLTPISDTFVAKLSRPGSRTRSVALMPNGTARLFTQ
jgi:type II secretory pathway pseudopilin PulG